MSRSSASTGVLAAMTAGILAVGAGAADAVDAPSAGQGTATAEVSPDAPVLTTTDPASPATTTAPAPTTTTAPAPSADPAAGAGTRDDDSLGDDSGGAGRAAAQRRQERAERQERREAADAREAKADRRKAAARRRAAARERERAEETATREEDDALAAGDPAAGAGPLSGDGVFAGVPSAVPGLFIARFRIPPFLLPIYQAAGVQYGIRWEILAAINEIETDYGRNLNVSSAGAQGWMQFMPATWKSYGVDADGDGTADPMSPVDAIFAAARYLRAAGAETDLRKAIFAYNHADWYVDSVLLRARLIGGLPAALVGSLSGLTQGQLPVAGVVPAGAKDGDAAPRIGAADEDDRAAGKNGADRAGTRAADGDAPVWGRRPGDPRAAQITARRGTEIVAVQDGTIIGRGRNAKMGRWTRMRDVFGNVYTYAHLGSLARTHEVSTSEDPQGTALTEPGRDPAPTAPASAGRQALTAPSGIASSEVLWGAAGRTPGPVASPLAPGAPAGAGGVAGRGATPGAAGSATTAGGATGAARVAPGSYGASAAAAGALAAGGGSASGSTAGTTALGGTSAAAGGDPSGAGASSGAASSAGGAKTRRGVVERPLRNGSRVTGGTVLGTIGVAPKGGRPGSSTRRVTMAFGVRPAGEGAPRVDPRPILDGWRLLTASTDRRRAKRTALFGPNASATSAGQVLLLSKERLQARVLADDRLDIPAAGRSQVRAGAIDRRVLATLAYLSASGHRLRVSSLRRPGAITTSGSASEHDSGNAVDIAEIDGQTISAATQGPGSVTDRTIRLLLRLQGTSTPHQIISLMLPSDFGGASNVLAMADHADHLHVGFRVSGGDGAALGRQLASALKPAQWDDLIDRLKTIENPQVAGEPSPFAVKVRRAAGR